MSQRPEHAVEGSRSGATAGSAVRWRLPVRPPPNADQLLFPWWIPSLFMLCALALGPWVVWLFISLPSREVAHHWDVAWTGLDVGLAALLAGTGIALALRSPVAAVLASMTAAVLICDAWFDVVTSSGTTTLAIALVEALLVELPLAIVCIWIARNIERVLSDARPFLQRAGFRVEHGRLVPPEAPAAGRSAPTHRSR
jgi:hypothetical protein